MSDSDYLEEQRGLRHSENLLIVFDDAVGAANRDAVTLTTWAAEKHADVVTLGSAAARVAHKGPRALRLDPLGWLKAFESVLLKLGWVGDFAFSTREMPEDDVRAEALELFAHEFEGEQSSMRLHLEQRALAGDWPNVPRLVGMVRESGGQPALRALLVVATRLPRSPALQGTAKEPHTPQSQLFARTLESTLLMPQFERVKAALLEKLRAAGSHPPPTP